MMTMLGNFVGTKHGAVTKTCDWNSLYETHGRHVYYLALRMLGDTTQAEDATHDVFLKAFQALDQFHGTASLRTWLFRITVNHCQNLRQTWHQRHVTAVAEESLPETETQEDSPLHVLEIKELGRRIHETLCGLPDEYQLLLLLVADEELSYDDIAQIMDLTPDAVRGKLYRARKAFAVEFQKSA